MFGFKIISEERYLDEQVTYERLKLLNDELTKENVRAKLEIKDLREQNTKLRSINSKRKEEIDSLVEKNRKLKEQVKNFSNIQFDPPKCELCEREQKDCKKLSVGDQEICILQKPSFRKKNK